jgi:hypothetical protein
MTEEELRHLVETQGVERKQSLSEKKEGLESLNARGLKRSGQGDATVAPKAPVQ